MGKKFTWEVIGNGILAAAVILGVLYLISVTPR